MTGLLCVVYILLFLILGAVICSFYLTNALWPVVFLLSFCLCIVLGGMLGAMDVQVQNLTNRVAALEAERDKLREQNIE